MSLFNNLDKEFDKNVLLKSRSLMGQEQECSSSCSGISIETTNFNEFSGKERDPYQPIDEDESTDLTITKVTPGKGKEPLPVHRNIPNDDIVVKKEIVNLVTKKALNLNLNLNFEIYLP